MKLGRNHGFHPWSPKDVDHERLTWLKCYGLPCHAWCNQFFKFIAWCVGEFVSCDANTEKQKALDVARFLVNAKYSLNLNEIFNVEINNII